MSPAPDGMYHLTLRLGEMGCFEIASMEGLDATDRFQLVIHFADA